MQNTGTVEIHIGSTSATQSPGEYEAIGQDHWTDGGDFSGIRGRRITLQDFRMFQN